MEETINELPEVDEVAVVAVEKKPVAFIRLEQHEEQCDELTPQRVLEFCQRRLPPSHWPQAVIFVDEFPRNEVGRIVRDVLVREHRVEVEAGRGELGRYAVAGEVRT